MGEFEKLFIPRDVLFAGSKIMNSVSQEYCGVVKYYGLEFDVHWDNAKKVVQVTARKDRYAIDFGTEYKAESASDALLVARQILKDTLWG